VAVVIRRGPRERLGAWIVTGPLGHFYGTVVDVSEAAARWWLSRVRARVRGG
jgi:hypothetical protein